MTGGAIAAAAFLLLLFLVAGIARRRRGTALMAGDGEYRFEVVGESHYQDEIEEIVGGRTEDSAEFFCAAVLYPDARNRYSKNAVAVRITGRTVGHLRDNVGADFKKAIYRRRYAQGACAALIVGGWQRRGGDAGSFGVRLNLTMPFTVKGTADKTFLRGS